MRIAISGSHYMGKSTMIGDFIQLHPEYSDEIEPFYKLQEDYGEEFAAQPTLECMLAQMDYSIERMNQCAETANNIFDRCPVDFIAYAMHIMDQDMLDVNDSEIANKFPAIKAALKNLDLIVFLPLTKKHSVDHPEDFADIDYRKAIDQCFKKLYRDEICDIFPSYQQPRIIELWGNRTDRMKKLATYL